MKKLTASCFHAFMYAWGLGGTRVCLGTLHLPCYGTRRPREVSSLQWDTRLQTTGQGRRYKLYGVDGLLNAQTVFQ